MSQGFSLAESRSSDVRTCITKNSPLSACVRFDGKKVVVKRHHIHNGGHIHALVFASDRHFKDNSEQFFPHFDKITFFLSGIISYEQSTMLLTMKTQQGHSDRGSAVTASAIQTVGGKTRSVVN